MKYWIDRLIGTWVQAIEVGVAHVNFRVTSDKSELTLSSNAAFRFSDDAEEVDLRENPNGGNITKLTRTRIEGLTVSKDGMTADLTFEGGKALHFFWDHDFQDNLFYIQVTETKEWGVF